MRRALTEDQEAQAQELAGALAELAREDLLEIARTLAAADAADLFGDNEFAVRGLAHRLAARAFERHLDQKKTATTPPA